MEKTLFSDESKPVTITELAAENVKILKAVQVSFDPAGGMVIVTGKNGAGKSSLLDSIMLALTGSAPGVENPIRDTESRAEVVVTLASGTERVRVRRVYTAKGDRVEITADDGSKFASPQTMLDALLGSIALDPLEFATMKPADRAAEMRRLAKLDFTALDENRRQLYEERTAVNRVQKQLQGMADKGGSPAEFAGIPDAPPDVNALQAARDALLARKADADKWDAEVSGQKNAAFEKLNEIDRLKKQIDELQHRLTALETELADAQDSIGSHRPKPKRPTDVEVQAATDALAKARDAGAAVDRKRRWLESVAAAKAKTSEAEALTKRIEELDSAKAKMLSEAHYPVDGLAVDDGDVTWHGVHFGQLSTGERLRISTRIAMQQNPRLRVILIREASMLDDDGKAVVASLAAEAGYQVFAEVVATNAGPVGIHIVDGTITALDGQPVSGPVHVGKQEVKP